ISPLQSTLQKIASNPTGQQYAVELLEQHEAAVDSLMETAPSTIKNRLQSNIAALKNPNTTQKLSSSLLYGMSKASSLVSGTYHARAPEKLKTLVTKITPQTRDQQCKQDLLTLSEKRPEELSTQLSKIHAETKALCEKLSSKKPEMTSSVAHLSGRDLEQLKTAHLSLQSALLQYDEISMFIKEVLKELRNIAVIQGKLSQVANNFDKKIAAVLLKVFPKIRDVAIEPLQDIQAVQQTQKKLSAREKSLIAQIESKISTFNHSSPTNIPVVKKLSEHLALQAQAIVKQKTQEASIRKTISLKTKIHSISPDIADRTSPDNTI
ncbi:MAG: hypothetical protein Q8R79_00075, partial [Legionellaceae bacterium]|nr:hypothetical protein [Legionellaceae bacterium]